jgi:hypothetical protein
MMVEFMPYIVGDFKDQKDKIEGWQSKFHLENHVSEYLKKLLLQMSLAQNILLQPKETISAPQAVKIITLWKCARRPGTNVSSSILLLFFSCKHLSIVPVYF